jgi:transketolase
VSPQQSADVTAAKLRGAGFEVRIIDGHDPVAIRDALAEHTAHSQQTDGQPFAIVAKTIKGWGFTSVLGSDVHGQPVPGDDKDRALAELDAMAQRLGAQWTDKALRIPAMPSQIPAKSSMECQAPTFQEALRQCGQEQTLEKGEMATRKAYGVALRAAGHAHADVVALDGDVKNSTYAETFAKDQALAARFFESRIAEQNMVSCACGLASAGKIPFVSTFGKFMVRGYDQIEMGFISRLNLKLVSSHVGVSLAADGPSQMALPDVAFFHAWSTVQAPDDKPFLYLLQPADAYAAYALTLAMAEHQGPCYLRVMRPDVPFLYDDTTTFSLGGHHVLAKGHDVLIVATGYMVHEALKALHHLREQGIQASLVDLYSLPFDDAALLKLAQDHGGKVLTVEDNYGAGIGAAVAGVLAQHDGSYTLEQMYVRRIPKSGRTPDDVLRSLNLSAGDIAHTATKLLQTVSR